MLIFTYPGCWIQICQGLHQLIRIEKQVLTNNDPSRLIRLPILLLMDKENGHLLLFEGLNYLLACVSAIFLFLFLTGLFELLFAG
jgi:hypothetical protein